MLQLTPQSRIWLALAPVDFRNGIDGLAAVCRRNFARNPLDGAIYVFRNRTGTTLKLLCYDGQGFWLCTKRLSQGSAPVVAARGRRRCPSGGPRAAGAVVERLPRPGRHDRRLAPGGLSRGRGRPGGRPVLLIVPWQPRRRLAEHGVAMPLQGYQIVQCVDPGLHAGGDQAGQEAGDVGAVRGGVEQTVPPLADEQL